MVASLAIGIGLGRVTASPEVSSKTSGVDAAASATTDSKPTEAVSSSAPSPTPTEESSLTSRGTIPLELGEPAEVYANEKLMASMTVKSIQVDPVCTGEYIRPAKNGHFVVLEASIETGDYRDFTDLAHVPSISTRTGGFHLVTPSGQVVEGNSLIGDSYGCFPETEMMPSDINIGENASGKLIFDVPTAEGSIVLPELGGSPANITGWEWEYPQK